MNIIISCIHYPSASGRFAAAALRRLGHDVRTLGMSTGNEIWRLTVADKYIWQPDGGLTQNWDDWQPDLIIHMDSSFAYHHPVYQDIPHVIWGVDNHIRSYLQPGIAHYFLAHKAISIQAYDDNTTWLPCAYDPTLHTPSPIPWNEREYDVCMLGVMYPKRQEMLAALTKAKVKVFAGTGLLGEDYVRAYQNSRIGLCVSAAGDVGQRIFEGAAMGCAVLTDPLPDWTALNLSGIVVYEDRTSMLAQVKELLAAPTPTSKKTAAKDTSTQTSEDSAVMLTSVGEFTATLGQQQVLANGRNTWDARAQVIVNWYERAYPQLVERVTLSAAPINELDNPSASQSKVHKGKVQ